MLVLEQLRRKIVRKTALPACQHKENSLTQSIFSFVVFVSLHTLPEYPETAFAQSQRTFLFFRRFSALTAFASSAVLIFSSFEFEILVRS